MSYIETNNLEEAVKEMQGRLDDFGRVIGIYQLLNNDKDSDVLEKYVSVEGLLEDLAIKARESHEGVYDILADITSYAKNNNVSNFSVKESV